MVLAADGARSVASTGIKSDLNLLPHNMQVEVRSRWMLRLEVKGHEMETLGGFTLKLGDL